MAKYPDLIVFVEELRPVCILIAETWLKSDIPDALCSLPGYKIYRRDHPDNRGYDGVCIYIKNELAHRFQIREFSLDTPGIDNLFVTLVSKEVCVTFGCVYRPRACASDTILVNKLHQLSSETGNLIVAGDFNIPELKWPLQTIPNGSGMPALFASMITESNMSQLITEPTRFRLGQIPSILDLVLTNDTDLISNVSHHPPLGKSDHTCITFDLQFIASRLPLKVQKTYSTTDFAHLSEAIAAADWEMVLSTAPSVDGMWGIFLKTLRSLISQFTRIRHSTCCPKRPWINDFLLRQIRMKKTLWQKFRRSRSDADYNAHRLFSNNLSLNIRRAKLQYEDKIASGCNRKEFYKYVRSCLSSKVTTPILRDSSGQILDNRAKTAELLADSFSSSFTAEPLGECPEIQLPRCQASIDCVHFSQEEVESFLSKTDPATSPGADGLTALLLKTCSSALSVPLSLIYRASLDQGVLPQQWSEASITPVFKAGDKLDPNNYRPISIVPIVAKIAERIVLSRLLPFLMQNRILPEQQHGFIPGRSVITNLLTCVDSWTRSLDGREPIDVLYMDFSKAFDRVPTRRLLHKLDHFGIRGSLLSWIAGFLSNRSFAVKVAGTLSSHRPVLSGVPQGSVLGPVLFLIYISDLAAILKSRAAFYADDLKIYGNPLSEGDSLRGDLDAISAWSSLWLLPLNAKKCSVLHLGPNNPRLLYTLNREVLQAVEEHTDLGVLITSKLSWSEHILKVVRKANKTLYLLSKAFSGCSLQTFVKLFITYVRPILEFAGPVWCPTLERDRQLLESVQRRATRIPFGIHRPSYQERLEMSGLTTFLDRRLRGDLIVCYRAIHGLFGVDLGHLFELNTGHLRGHHLKLKKEPFKTSTRQAFLPNRVFSIWNGLPAEVVSAPSVNCFKNRLDSVSSDPE